MKLNLTKKIVLSLFGALFTAHMHAAEVKVAVAANFAKTLEEITVQFEKDTGHKVLATPGATGKFYAQIVNGAPLKYSFQQMMKHHVSWRKKRRQLLRHTLLMQSVL